jgi:acyl-CoA synthetase (AMP-forming)/AMP-acid ligase II
MAKIRDLDRSTRTVGQVIHNGARRFPNRVAIRMRDGRGLTYAQLRDRSVRLANALSAVGVAHGDRVATWLADGFEYVEIYFACAQIGAIVAPINARSVGAEAQYLIENADARCLIWTPDMDGHVATLPNTEGLLTIAAGKSELRADYDYEALLSSGAASAVPALVRPNDLFILGYTSGTTGRPKGAMMTHRSVLAAGRLNGVSLRFTGQTVHALTGSMSFVSVVPGHVLAVLAAGGTLVMMAKWDVASLASVIEEQSATFTYIPSPMLVDFTDTVRRRPQAFASLNSLVHSASKGESSRVLDLLEVIGTHRYVESWGMTEHSGAGVTATVPEDYADPALRLARAGTVGRATVDAAVRVIDADGAELPWDGSTVGELTVWSPALMVGYWNQEEATERAFVDGWYRSGDLGTIDPDGYVTIADRRTDLIVSGGMNVYPSEVEEVIDQLAGVVEVSVVGLPHDRWGQTVTAVVVAAPDSGLTADAVIEHCRRLLASYKKPTSVVFIDELPKTASLKISRAAVRELAAQRTSAR